MSFFESEAGTGRTRERMYREVQEGAGRSSRMSLAAAIAAIAIFVLVAAYSVYQVTAPAETQVILERGVASVTDIDAYLAESLPEIRETAEESQSSRVELPGYPLPVTLTAEEVRERNDAEVRGLLLQRSANMVDEQGLEAFAQANGQSLGLLSIEGIVANLLGLLTGSTHSQAGFITVVAAFVVAIAGAIIAASDLRPGVIKTIGGALLAGAFVGFLMSAALVFIFSRAGGDPFSSDLAGIAADIFEVPRRNYFIVMVFAALLFAGGVALNIIERRASHELYSQDIAYQQGDPLAGGAPAFEYEYHDDDLPADYGYDDADDPDRQARGDVPFR